MVRNAYSVEMVLIKVFLIKSTLVLSHIICEISYKSFGLPHRRETLYNNLENTFICYVLLYAGKLKLL